MFKLCKISIALFLENATCNRKRKTRLTVRNSGI